MKPRVPTLLSTSEETLPDALPTPDLDERLSRRQFLLRNGALLAAATFVQSNEETGHLSLTRHDVRISFLKAPVRVVQLSDLHRSWCVSEAFIAQIVARANALQPDLILLSGDFVTRSSSYAESCMRHLQELRAPMGRFAVLGNHDYWCDGKTGGPAIAQHLTDIGVEVLTNRSVRLDHNLRLVGVDDGAAGNPDLPVAFARMEAGEALLAMTHNPMLFPWLREYPCVSLAGHTHGGQVNLPFITDAIISGNSRYIRGWYKEPDAPGQLYVSRGLGTVHVPVRLNSTPEIAVFNLIPA
ncbi:MAG: putative phosphohydrolase [Chthonomonadales bacterium]|nr:putative phosphohydrolase [Chthonomonadales bacterium]